MGEILNYLESPEAWLGRGLSVPPSEIPATLAVPACLILLAVAATLLRHATIGTASAILAVLFLGLQVMNVETQWRVLGFGSVMVLLILTIILHERRVLVRRMREDMLDMETRFDSFLTALDRRHALLEARGMPRDEILPPTVNSAPAPSTPEPVN